MTSPRRISIRLATYFVLGLVAFGFTWLLAGVVLRGLGEADPSPAMTGLFAALLFSITLLRQLGPCDTHDSSAKEEWH